MALSYTVTSKSIQQGSFYDKISQGDLKPEFDLKHLLYKISLTSPVWYIILGGAGGELTTRILRIQK
jgi:hypothetical protein